DDAPHLLLALHHPFHEAAHVARRGAAGALCHLILVLPHRLLLGGRIETVGAAVLDQRLAHHRAHLRGREEGADLHLGGRSRGRRRGEPGPWGAGGGGGGVAVLPVRAVAARSPPSAAEAAAAGGASAPFWQA